MIGRLKDPSQAIRQEISLEIKAWVWGVMSMCSPPASTVRSLRGVGERPPYRPEERANVL